VGMMPPGTRISQPEKFYLQEQLRLEQLCLNKCNLYMNQIQDPALRGVVQQLRDVCQGHVNTITSVLQQSGFQPQV